MRPGGRLAFTTIELSEGLRGAARRQAVSAAPQAASSRRPYVDLLASARYAEVLHDDLTGEYLTTARGWLENVQQHYDELVSLDGEATVEERVAGWREAIDALEAGLLRRSLYAATRP